MGSSQYSNLGGFLDFGQKKAKAAAASAMVAAQQASQAIQEAQGAVRQGREILTTAQRISEDAESYLKRIQNIPIEELARRFDFKSKVAVEELLSLSAFMKKALLYLCAIATLSVYLSILTKKD
jgi:hypothetical protein